MDVEFISRISQVSGSSRTFKTRWGRDPWGYDVPTFSLGRDELFIEVKTTNGSELAPFFVTANEVAVSARHAEKFRLYRVFEFASGPKLYIQPGSLGEAFQLDAVVWRATPASPSL